MAFKNTQVTIHAEDSVDTPGCLHVENCFLDESNLHLKKLRIVSLKNCSFKNHQNAPVILYGSELATHILVVGCDFYCPKSSALIYRTNCWIRGDNTIFEMRANRFCCMKILITDVSSVQVALFDSVVYSWANAFQLNSHSTLVLQNNDLHLLSRIMIASMEECDVILLGGNDTHGYGGNLVSTFFEGKPVIVRGTEEFETLMSGQPIKEVTLSKELRDMVGETKYQDNSIAPLVMCNATTAQERSDFETQHNCCPIFTWHCSTCGNERGGIRIYCSMCIERDHAEHELSEGSPYDVSDSYYQSVRQELQKLNSKPLPNTLGFTCVTPGCVFFAKYKANDKLPDVSALGGVFALPFTSGDN
eukprot:TRINITY_DN2337_c0_g1_i4.p1 TRINITY_DN2337_c0_g1~~TRINITY_DN2337_c0_g1_i4.p1  ORF type:complete len:361 (+),score=21.06 TRINITY_DN2337_c0_g1_i4:1-1083(+)